MEIASEALLRPPRREESIAFPVRLSPVIWRHVEVAEQPYSGWRTGIGFPSSSLVPCSCIELCGSMC